jgi:hypothetical protein
MIINLMAKKYCSKVVDTCWNVYFVAFITADVVQTMDLIGRHKMASIFCSVFQIGQRNHILIESKKKNRRTS